MNFNNTNTKKLNLHFQRFEFKYFLPKSKADKLIPTLLNYMEWDPYIVGSGKDFYEVNSLYFDSSDFGCFWDKESGVADRKKLRFRFYNQLASDNIFLEIKRKNDALVIKDRIKLSGDDCLKKNLNQKLLELANQDEKNEFLRELIWFKNRNCLEPKLFITYKRKAFIGKLDKRFRATFDYDILSAPSSDMQNLTGTLKPVYPEGVVFELKFNNILPAWFHQIIQQYQLQRLAYSKYCNSLRVVDPRFDDNNYNPA